jgi:hypothetical protein
MRGEYKVMKEVKLFFVYGFVRVGHTVRKVEKYYMTTTAPKARDMFFADYPYAKGLSVQECKK